MTVLLLALTLLVSFIGHPYLIGSLDLSQGLKSVQGCRLSCRMLQIDEKIAVDDGLRFKVMINIVAIAIIVNLLAISKLHT